jgi:hypothetical protein
MHSLLLPTDFLGLTLGHMVIHPKIGLTPGALTQTPLHQLLIRSVSHPLITAVMAPVLTLSRIMVVVVPSIGFVLRERKALIVIDVIGRFVGTSSEQCQARQRATHRYKCFFDSAQTTLTAITSHHSLASLK